MAEPILTVKNLKKSFYLHQRNKHIHSCNQVNLQVLPRELTAIIGVTGSGKSSVLRCIYRSYLVEEGEVNYRCANGELLNLARANEHRILELRQQEIGFVTQFLHCLPRKSALEVVQEPLLTRGEPRQSAEQKAEEMLSYLQIPESLWQVPPATFSGGEQQRVNLARALVWRPRLLLLDEPTASLDATTSTVVVKLLKQICNDGTAMLAIFHDPNLVERLANRIINLNTKELAREQ